MARLRSPDWHLRTRLKVRQLALLVAVADHGSVRRAADLTAVTQPAATRMLRELEDALGVSLFDRHAWGMTPTAYGETLLRYARGMLTDLVGRGRRSPRWRPAQKEGCGWGPKRAPCPASLHRRYEMCGRAVRDCASSCW